MHKYIKENEAIRHKLTKEIDAIIDRKIESGTVDEELTRMFGKRTGIMYQIIRESEGE
jgi:hypothetical protein